VVAWVKVATPEPFTLAEPIVMPSAEKVTVPVGEPLLPVTVAVRVTLPVGVTLVGDAANLVVEELSRTVTLTKGDTEAP
jgi:hypothetical protein